MILSSTSHRSGAPSLAWLCIELTLDLRFYRLELLGRLDTLIRIAIVVFV